MKQILLLFFASIVALQSWGIDVTYDYTSDSNLLSMGFDSNEISTNYSYVYNKDKVLNDAFAVMTYQHFLVGKLDSRQFLYLCSVNESNNHFGENWSGRIQWTAKNGCSISKVVIETITGASLIQITTNSGSASPYIIGNTVTCVFPSDVSAFTISAETARIKSITVSYNSIYDVNEDGVVDPYDANCVVHVIWNIGNYSFPAENTDIDGDGRRATVQDWQMIINFLRNNPMNLDITPYIRKGDVNSDGVINESDLGAILSHFISGQPSEDHDPDNPWNFNCIHPQFDINSDGKCDNWDYVIVGILIDNGYTTPIVTGDLTGEGDVDVGDVNAVINIILHKKTEADYSGNADISGDGVIDIVDVNAIINIILTNNK